MTLRAGLLLLCCPLVGCATARVVRLDTGEGTPPIVYTPARKVPPVEIDQREFEQAMTTLLLEMKFSLTDEGPPLLRLASAMDEPGGRYDRWCLQQSSPDECLGLLRGDLSQADASVRRQLALSFAWDGVWDGVAAEVRGMVDPVMLKLMISTAFAAYVGLLILPEPVTKVVAVALTTFLIAYIGVDVFLDILDGWRELSARSERARSFGELEDAGHRFGDVMGRDGARVIIMAMTAALGGGAAHFASKAPRLPGFARAVLRVRTNAGFELSVVLQGGARSVTVAEGVMTVGVAPNALAAVAAGPPGGAIRPGGLRSGAAKVATPYGPAVLADTAAALAARTQVEQGATLYRIGTTGKSAAGEAQFWALEHPMSPGFAQRYGIPPENITNANFIETATLKPGTPFVTRPAPAFGPNPGGGIEVVVPPGGVELRSSSAGGGW